MRNNEQRKTGGIMKKVVNNAKDLGDFVKQKRMRMLMSQLKLSEEAGITQATLCRLERGEKSVHLDTMVKILKSLGGQLVIETPEED